MALHPIYMEHIKATLQHLHYLVVTLSWWFRFSSLWCHSNSVDWEISRLNIHLKRRDSQMLTAQGASIRQREVPPQAGARVLRITLEIQQSIMILFCSAFHCVFI